MLGHSQQNLSPRGALVSCVRALAREQVLDRARTVRRTVLAGFRNDEWHAVGARVLVGARVQVSFNGQSLGRTIHVRLGASLDARPSVVPHTPNGHRPALTTIASAGAKRSRRIASLRQGL